MPEYRKQERGYMVVQDWALLETYSNDSDDVQLRYLTPRQQAALVTLCDYLLWRTRYVNPPDLETRETFKDMTIWRLIQDVDFCALVEDCIKTHDGTKSAIKRLLSSNGTHTAPGETQTEEEFTENQAAGTNDTCNLDILWAQCLAVVQTTNRAITDTLEKIEGASNGVELANVMDDLPFVEEVSEISTLDTALGLFNYYQEAVDEEYAAQYTLEKENELACALFCACRSDCVVTSQRMFDVMSDRLSEFIAPPTLTGIVDLAEFLAGVSVDTPYVVDLAFFGAWATVRFANFLFETVFDHGLKFVLALAVNDASDDWMLLCTECPFDVTFLLNPVDEHLTIETATGLTIGGFTIIVSPWTVTLVMDFAVNITNVEIVMSNELSGGVAPVVDAIVNTNVYNLWNSGGLGGSIVTPNVDMTETSDTVIIQADHDFHYLFSIRVQGTY